MSNITFVPHLNDDGKIKNVEVQVNGSTLPQPLDNNYWIRDVSKYLPMASGELYLDKSMAKIIFDGSFTGGGALLEDCWLEIIPYSSEVVILTFPDCINPDIAKCEYPFSVSSKGKRFINGDNKDGSTDEVRFYTVGRDDKYCFTIRQNQDECLNATISKGNQVRNIDTSSGNNGNPLFYFKGDVGIYTKKVYIDGEFIIANENAFGFYLESSTYKR